MRVSDFEYVLPPERIAQEPASERDAARLFVHDPGRDASRHLHVRDLPDVLAPGDLLVLNDTRVRPARLFGRRASGGAVELLLLGPIGDGQTWRAMVKPARKLAAGEVIEVADGSLEARMGEREGQGAVWSLTLADPRAPERPVVALLEEHGRAPLPPYIARERGSDPRDALDQERYQTVFARESGAVAAPTAGLHFTSRLLEELAGRGVERTTVTLHVGAGTFAPVQVEDAREHEMHAEHYELTPEAAAAIERCRARGGRVVAVGTTSVRTLEACAAEDGQLRPGIGVTRLFIAPGYRFRVVNALVTNFHLPRSTLLMLVSAFAGRERILRLYAEAVERAYRFYSYGDAMLLLPAR